MLQDSFDDEVASGQRFEFGHNWQRFLTVLDDERIAAAQESLRSMLDRDDLKGLRFVDAGSGSGLFSLAARELGATVHSFDYDPASVACTEELRRRYAPGDSGWTVDRASVLDREYLTSLGEFDVVYSWGVLHHTGAMWTGLDNLAAVVGPSGLLYIALYNDQGLRSRIWRTIKRAYNGAPRIGRAAIVSFVGAYFALRTMLARRISNRPRPQSVSARGMSRWYDLIDWVGGYPYEVATPDAVFDHCRAEGFVLEQLRTVRGHGCNEYVFRRARQATGGSSEDG